MLKSGYNPVRRNRNIGTAAQGHGRNNTMEIPSVCGEERVWWENLGPHSMLERVARSLRIVFLVEYLRKDCVHACTVSDICHLISHVSAQDCQYLDTIVLRQPTRKQELLKPIWGRLAYSAALGLTGKKTRRAGPAILLEAVNPTKVWKWNKDLSRDDSLELDRLRSDGHIVEDTRKRLLIHSSLESVRATQLYRTLLHEIGHWVDWLEKVVRPAEGSQGRFEVLEGKYFARPAQERELFAHKYADKLRLQLTAKHHIPFARIPDALKDSK